MVVFRATEVHFTDTMKSMNTLRQEEAFCDIRLTIGARQIHAHRCVLAAGSPYFRSLFLGQFTEASMEEISLSSVTNDIIALELIVDFIYTGEINITNENLGVIVKLCSFFLVDRLRAFCCEFMLKSLTLQTCLKYYSYAVDHGFSELEPKTSAMVASRFHDYLIYEERTIEMTPNELHYLLEKDMLEFCSAASVLEFIAKWVRNGLTEEHAAVGIEIVDYVNSMSASSHAHSLEHTDEPIQNLYENVKLALEGTEVKSGTKFLRRYKRIISKMAGPTSPLPKGYNLRLQSPRSRDTAPETENTLITISPRPCVIEAVEKRIAKGRFYSETIRYSEPVFDLCAFVPSSHCWYHIHTFTDQGVPGALLDEMTFGVWKFMCMREQLVFILLGDETLYFYDLKTLTWREVSYQSLGYRLGINEIYFDVVTVVGRNQTVYLILKIKVCNNDDFDEVRQIYLRCYELRPDDTWQFLFDSPKYDTDFGDCEMYAAFSTQSNEMLMLISGIYVSEESHFLAYVVNMGNLPSSAPVVRLETRGDIDQDIYILEAKNQFYIVTDMPIVYAKHEYKYNSLELTVVDGSSKHIADYTDRSSEPYPCLYRLSLSDGTALWCISGSKEGVSSLTKLTINRNKNPVAKAYTPPPFPCVTTAFAGQLNAAVLANLKPISHHMTT